jgi:uncharacterized membrane protein
MTDGTQVPVSAAQGLDPGLVTYTHVIYALHALSVIIGVTGSVSIFGAFVFGIPSIVGVIMNYARRDATRGTYLESHFRWQIRTFWYALLVWIIVAVVSAPLILLLGLGFATYLLGVTILGLWIAYRVVRGWLALRDGRAMYV